MKINKRTGQKRDPKTGQFKRKPKPGNANTPALAASATFLEHLARLSDPEVVARKVARLARSGDWTALQLQVQSLSMRKPKTDSQMDYSKLSSDELRTLMRITSKAMGKDVGEITAAPVRRPDPVEEILGAQVRIPAKRNADSRREAERHSGMSPSASN
jgi:hypothetical protein